jgi:hypothetical protein
MTLYPNVLVIVATNYPWNMDSAFRRRFDFKVHVGLPEKRSLSAMIKYHCRDYLAVITDQQYRSLAEKKEQFTGGDVANYHQEIGRFYLNYLYSQKYFRPCPLRKGVMVPTNQKDSKAVRLTRAEYGRHNIDIAQMVFEDLVQIMNAMPVTVTQLEANQHVSYEQNAAYDPQEEERQKEKAQRVAYYSQLSTAASSSVRKQPSYVPGNQGGGH